MYVMIGVLDVNEIVAKMVAAVIVLMWNFWGRKLMLFRKKKVG